ncbi:C-X-C motif chemokine 17-like [Nannospalax galili]|uniref:C-X-C motif chemokine 17-like n=1 Tax=Nannospalax galili TaxID=1026970 RepID=UPI0004ED6F97|nr:C-X-C motif chemokine 17-like [Nannospalax galili]
MKLLVPSLLLLLLAMLVSTVSSRPKPGLSRNHRDQRQASRRWLQEGSQECQCKDWFLRAPGRKFTAEPRTPRKHCPCDHLKSNVKKSRHQKHHRKPNRNSRACQRFLKQCQLASFALPL